MGYFTLAHILISLLGIGAGFGLIAGLTSGKILSHWWSFFFWSTFLTSLSGFAFPFRGLTPAVAVGIISMLLLALAAYAYDSKKVAGAWKKRFVIASAVALYLNVFVLVTQLFQKVPVLNALAPTQTEPAFVISHLVLLGIFLLLGRDAVKA